MIKARKLGTVGDINPIEYGGGYVLSVPEQGQWVEYFHGLDCESRAWEIELDNPEHLKREVTIYRVDIKRDGESFLKQYSWVDWDAVSLSCGYPDDYEPWVPSKLRLANDRASALMDATGYYGWHEFDHYPLTLTLGELIKRWEKY